MNTPEASVDTRSFCPSGENDRPFNAVLPMNWAIVYSGTGAGASGSDWPVWHADRGSSRRSAAIESSTVFGWGRVGIMQ